MSARRWLQLVLVLAATIAAAVATFWRVNAPADIVRVGIFTASRAEAEPFAAYVTEKDVTMPGSAQRYDRGVIGNVEVVFVVTGAGLVNAAARVQQAIDVLDVTHVIYTGIAGGLDPELTPGTVVVPRVWFNYQRQMVTDRVSYGMNPDVPPPVATLAAENVGGLPVTIDVERDFAALDGVVVGGTGLSGDAFIANGAMRNRLRNDFGASIVDMESAAVAQVALINGVPYIVVRAVSDSADATAARDITANAGMAAEAAARVTVEIVRGLE